MKIKYHPRAIKFLDKLEPKLKVRIINKIKLLKNDHFRYLTTVQGTSALKMRIGNYRAFVDVNSNLILILEIRHRRNAYKR